MVAKHSPLWGWILCLFMASLIWIMPPHAQASETQVSGGGLLRLEILAQPQAAQPVVSEMILVTIRAVYDLKIANEKMEIAPSDAFDWIQIRPDHWREERIEGHARIVMERDLALWPKRAGLLHFGPVTHHLTVIDRQSQRQEAKVTAQPLALSVGDFPGPATLPSQGWKFTARALEISEELDGESARLADGQLLTRKIRLRALGALPSHLPPRPVVSENWLIVFTPPIEKTLTLTEDGPLAEVLWTWQLRPHTGEPGLLEPVKIPWFDTTTRQIAQAEIPSLPLGYASFFTSQMPLGDISPGQIARLGLTFLAGFFLVPAAAIFAFRLKVGRLQTQQRLARFNPLLRLRIWRARRSGDLMALRRDLGRIGAPDQQLAQIEAQIFRPPNGG